MDFDRLITEYCEYLEVEKGYSPFTIRDYSHYLTRFSKWAHAASIRPQNIDLEVVRKYRLYLSRLKCSNGNPLKRITQSYHVIALRAFLRYLLVQRDIPVLSPDKVELPRETSRSITFLDLGQVERLLNTPDTATTIGLRDRAILEILFSTGVRVSELVSLNRDHINMKHREFGVVGKGQKPRVVFLSETAATWLGRYLRTRQDNLKPLFIRCKGSTSDAEKMRLTARSIQRIVEKYAKVCGLPIEISPHTLRHSFATDLLMGGADIRSVQEMLGHESIRTTQVYTHVTNRQLRESHKAHHGRR
ncbi:tyrosine-type recombinase/integrase [Chloroflexota bacterium]